MTADPRLPRETSLLLLTAMDNPFDPNAMKALGFAACLTKPVRRSTLFDTIADVLAPRPCGRGCRAVRGDGEPRMGRTCSSPRTTR